MNYMLQLKAMRPKLSGVSIDADDVADSVTYRQRCKIYRKRDLHVWFDLADDAVLQP